ncbi:restriction endonuclease subunit S [Acidithiobacillus ferridurans]|nr:restriction endonuclease subunit S [Acidithiobacillus ferridurans]
MSPKTPSTVLTPETKPALVPKLRFPEFRGAEGWKPVTLEEASTPVTERVGERKLTPVSISAGIGFVPQAEKFGRDISGNQYQVYTLVRDGDFVFNKGNSLKFPQGCVYLLQGWGQVAAPNVFICFRLKDGYSNGFFQQCFEQNQHGRELKRHITSGARSNGLLNICKETFFGVVIPTPSPAEQQKIAECLSSVDDLIAAQTRKVDALKTHKKALMQQLFPREGETQPRLRFPEFQNALAWEVKPLGRVVENLDNQRVPITSSDREAGDVPYYGASGIVDYVEGFIFDEDLLCVSEDGANLVARTYPIAFPISGKTWVNNHAHVLRFENACTQKFVEVYLNSIKLDDFITGMAQPKLNKAMLDRIPIPHPRVPEQQIIADCLSSLDALITLETQKLEALKTHKKGLMQQLFPSPEETADL